MQRSGRPELLFASAAIGTLVGAAAVAAAIGKDFEGQDVASVALVIGGGVAGAVAGTVIATPLVPQYIPDNQAFFALGATWIGAAEGMGARLPLAAGQHQQRHGGAEIVRTGGSLAGPRSATSCARRSWAACPAWRSA